ncbi:MAG: asparagine synthase-related protein [Kiritimatiellaeota bacterium]|nr:asparagine synthase-related protein [Kiritimatiellota bacterium]
MPSIHEHPKHGDKPPPQSGDKSPHPISPIPQPSALSLLSGGLDSMLAVCVLRAANVHVEGVVFASPFFDDRNARRAAEQLKIKLHTVDFTDDIFALLDHPPHGFGGAMNPCIDCHARMIQRAGELMQRLGFDFIATGEVLGQRPMSQNKQALGIVGRGSQFEDVLVRPLSAQLLAPAKPERDGLLDRAKLLALNGRSRKPQIELAKQFGLTFFPAPAGGCLLTEKGYSRRLAAIQQKFGLQRRLVKLLRVGRCFRLPEGALCLAGRDERDNEHLRKSVDFQAGDILLRSVNVPGPTLLIPCAASGADLADAVRLCAAYSDPRNSPGDLIVKHATVAGETLHTLAPPPRGPFAAWLV